ncbi:MAG TPA: RNA ligase family protein [Kofleriaceae bacterium]|nr:RNA ligase family protein [Kofleriaceae bacterium]
MRFRMFPKIPTHRAAPPRSMGGPWVALEKLHGAHLIVASDGDAIHVGKRKAWLGADEPFFGWQLIAGELAAGVRAIARETTAKQTVLFGELIGGGYPHPEVQAVPGLQPVQTGIWYTPALVWVAFDVLVAAGDDDEGELLAHRELEELAGAAGVRTPPRLARGTRADLERVGVRFPTSIPAWFGLPPLADNLAEGLVLKPDARCAAADRPVIKRKLPEFDDDRFGEAEAWRPGRLGEAELLAWVERLVQPARLASARSKVGADPAAIVDEVALDVAIDLGLAFREAWDHLAADAQERVLARARDLAREQLAATSGG